MDSHNPNQIPYRLLRLIWKRKTSRRAKPICFPFAKAKGVALADSDFLQSYGNQDSPVLA